MKLSDVALGDCFDVRRVLTKEQFDQLVNSRKHLFQNISISIVDGIFIMHVWDEYDFDRTWTVIDEKLYNELLRFEVET